MGLFAIFYLISTVFFPVWISDFFIKKMSGIRKCVGMVWDLLLRSSRLECLFPSIYLEKMSLFDIKVCVSDVEEGWIYSSNLFCLSFGGN